MPTHQDETLPQRYAREHQDYLKLCGSMTAEQVADLQLQLNNSLAREQALQQRLTAADERADVLEGLLAKYYSRSDVCAFMAKDIDAALKPADGGGDHVKHYECIGKGGDYTVVAIAQGAGTLKGFNHYVYKNADGVHFVRDPEDFLSRMQIRP